jgi:multidrug resistance efflux pump
MFLGTGCLFLLGIRFCHNSGGVSTEGWHPVELEIGPRVIQEVGTLEAKELVRIQAEITGVITEIAEDGSPVEQGQTLFKLDEEELQNKLETELEALEQAREDLESQLAEYAVLTNSFHIRTQLKVAERDHAALELERGSIPLTEEETRLMEIDIALAELDLQEKEAELVRQEELVRRNFAPPSSIDRIRLETAAAKTFLEEKQSQFALARQPVTEEDRLTLKAALDKAEKEVQRNEERQALQLRTQDLTLKGQEIDIRHKVEYIERLREDIKRVHHTAPTDGIVRLFRTYAWAARAWQPLSVGKRINARDMAATIVDPNQLSLRLMLHESDFPEVKPGQPVRAYLTAFPDEEITGRIASVAEVGQDRDDLSPLYNQSPPIGQALFLARVDLDIEDTNAMPGMTTHVEIEVAASADRIYIPTSTLITSEPPFQVLRRREGNVEQVTVEGEFDAVGRFHVTKGLQEGDWVKEVGQ